MKTKKTLVFLSLGAALIALILLSMRFGSVFIDGKSFLAALLRREGFAAQSAIIYTLRLPRTVAGILAGAGLGLSGVLLQSVTDNKMASPGLIGVNSGAGFAVILALSLSEFPIELILDVN